MKSWRQKIQCNRFCLISVGVLAVLRILFSIKNLGQYKKFHWDKFVKKKDQFDKYLAVSKILVDVLELSMLINVSLH